MIPQSGCIGLLTAGGDCPGLNAALRSVTLAALAKGMRVVGFMDGFAGLVENNTMELSESSVNNILSQGGTILGTSRTKIHKYSNDNEIVNMEDVALDNIMTNHIDTLVCLGGGGTQKNSLKLAKRGVKIVTLPKTIDNDVWGTDLCFGYDSAVQIATDALERLQTTASSHHRIMVCELMGHRAGWLTLSAGMAAGADVILLPEIPYDLTKIAHHIEVRKNKGLKHSVIAVAEGAISKELALFDKDNKKQSFAESKPDTVLKFLSHTETYDDKSGEAMQGCPENNMITEPLACKIARQLQDITSIESRFTVLGHIQRGGVPSAADKQLCTMLGTHAVSEIAAGKHNIMAGWKNARPLSFPLEEIAGKRKLIQEDHPLLQAARMIGVCLGD